MREKEKGRDREEETKRDVSLSMVRETASRRARSVCYRQESCVECKYGLMVNRRYTSTLVLADDRREFTGVSRFRSSRR